MAEEDPGAKQDKVQIHYPVHFVADEIQSKTAFGEAVTADGATSYPTLWTENDTQVAVSLNFGGAKAATVNPSADFKTATFDADFSQSEVSAPYTFYALSPFSAYVGASESHGGYHFNIPATQTPLALSCDEAAQVMAASQTVESLEDFSSVKLHFNHVTAYGKLTLRNLAIPEGAEIQSIELTSSTPFAGRFYYKFEDGSLEESSASRTLTLLPDNLSVDASGTLANIWFACAPADLGGGTLKVDVNTSTGILSRTIEIGTGKLAFKKGGVSKFAVDMTSAVFTEVSDRWILVTDASTLAAGDEIIIANSATAGAAYALSTTQNTNNRGRAAISIAQDKDGQMIIQNPGTTVEVLTLVSGYYSGYFYLKETTSSTGRYLGTTSSTNNNYLQSNSEASATSASYRGYYNWGVSITDNVAYITAYQSVRKSNRTNYKHLRHNNSSSIFSAYLSTSRNSWSGDNNTQSVYIYRKESGVNINDDPILQQDVYGAYLAGGNHLWGIGDQLSREYMADGTLTFAILSPTTYEVAEFNGIPVDPAKGDSFTLNYNLITGRKQSDTDYNVTVVKVDGPKVWLSDNAGNGFIVKK